MPVGKGRRTRARAGEQCSLAQSGEGGIRTLERGCPRYSLSRRVPSAARPPLQETFDSMHRMAILAVVAASLFIVLIAIQFVLPPIVAHRVESELTKHGGHARVHLSALPAPRLLFKEGDSLEVRATGIVTPAASGDGNGGLS